MFNTLFRSGLVVKSPILGYEEAVAYSVGWDAEVKQTQKQKRLLMQVSGFHTPHIQLGSTSYNSAFWVRGFNPVNTVVITYNQTNRTINYRNRRFERNELLLLTRDEELDLVISGENTTFTIAVDEVYFFTMFRNYYGTDFESKLKNSLLLDSKKEAAFLNFLHFWINFFLSHETTDFLPQDYARIEEDILHTLFNFIIIKDQNTKSENKILKEARNLIEQSLDLDLKLSDLAAYLGISQRTLEYTFKQNLGMTPKNYLQMLRLHTIREELKSADVKTLQVSDIALKYGFFHMGHFASEYKKLFGESPSHTLKHKN